MLNFYHYYISSVLCEDMKKFFFEEVRNSSRFLVILSGSVDAASCALMVRACQGLG